jgi:predicted nucleic acid-binding protein
MKDIRDLVIASIALVNGFGVSTNFGSKKENYSVV